MLWQVVVAGMIGSLFYVRRFITWLREHSPFRTSSSKEATALSRETSEAKEFTNQR